MDHVIASSTAAFAGTTHALDFTIFHDGLSAWWEADAQAHLAARGFANRQIRNITANKGTRYENKIVGDSPEMCRALDSHGFADLKAAIVNAPLSLPSIPPVTLAASTSAHPRSSSAPSSAPGPSLRP